MSRRGGARARGGRGCVATNSVGRPCGAAPLRGRERCFVHDAGSAPEAAEARRLGGLHRRRESTLAAAFELEDLAGLPGIRRIAELVAYDAVAMDPGSPRGRLMLAAARVLLEVRREAEVEERIAALEEAILARHEGEPPRGRLLGRGGDRGGRP